MSAREEQPDSGRWVELIDAGAVAPGSARTVIVAGRLLAVCNDAGRFAVVDNTCPHAGGNLGAGLVRDGRIVCPWHLFGWDLTTGQCLDPWPRRLRVYPSKVQAGRVLAMLPACPAPATEAPRNPANDRTSGT